MVAYTEDLNQTATYWAPGALDAAGNVALASPVILSCRWQRKRDLVRNNEGREVVSMVVAYVDQQLATQGYLALGDATGSPDPRLLADAFEIVAEGASPDLDDDETLYKVWL